MVTWSIREKHLQARETIPSTFHPFYFRILISDITYLFTNSIQVYNTRQFSLKFLNFRSSYLLPFFRSLHSSHKYKGLYFSVFKTEHSYLKIRFFYLLQKTWKSPHSELLECSRQQKNDYFYIESNVYMNNPVSSSTLSKKVNVKGHLG